MIQIELRCPVCDSIKLQYIPEEVITELDKRGQQIGLVLIPENVICEHLFLVEIDQNFRVVKTYDIGKLLASEALQSVKEITTAEEIKASITRLESINYVDLLDRFLLNWSTTKSIQKEISDGKMQNLMYLYKDLVSGIAQIIKDEIYLLIAKFEEHYNDVLKKNLENLKVYIPPTVVDTIIEKLYKNGLEILTQFYSVQIIYIEEPFVKALAEISESDNDDLPAICTDINNKLANTVREQFGQLQEQLKKIQTQIYGSLDKFQLEIIPKSVDITISNIFVESLENITQNLQNWSSEWVA